MEKVISKRGKFFKIKLHSLMPAALIWIALLSGCNSNEKTLKVAATPIPHAEILEQVKEELESEGIHLKIVEVDDYNLPNRLLFEKQVDANFFQHQPFLDEQNLRFGYNLKTLVAVHIEPLGIYSLKITSLAEIKDHALVAIPSDPTNEARALRLLADLSLIKLKQHAKSTQETVYDIDENPKHLKFIEVDAPFLPRSLQDVDLAVIPANFALQAHLNPSKDALALETPDSPYVNIIAIRQGDEEREAIQKLKKAITSTKLKNYLKDKYKGELIPAF